MANQRIVAKTLGLVSGVQLGLMMALYSLVLGVALDKEKGAAAFATWFLVTFGTPVLLLKTGIWIYLHVKSAASRTMRMMHYLMNFYRNHLFITGASMLGYQNPAPLNHHLGRKRN